LNDLRALLANPEAAAARTRLNDRRNDDSHLRKVDPTGLPHAINSAAADLRTLLEAAKFLSDLSLIHVTAMRWDSISAAPCNGVVLRSACTLIQSLLRAQHALRALHPGPHAKKPVATGQGRPQRGRTSN